MQYFVKVKVGMILQAANKKWRDQSDNIKCIAVREGSCDFIRNGRVFTSFNTTLAQWRGFGWEVKKKPCTL